MRSGVILAETSGSGAMLIYVGGNRMQSDAEP